MIDKVFGNRYRIVERIGIGGMAEVYRATDEVLGRTVALKLMLPQYAQDPTFAARFKQEAQSAANLQSPFIVNIYDWGRDEADETFYIVMELVRGTDLKTAINQRGALNQRKAAEVAAQVCSALSVAHSYDIIHRDIKPHNIMVQPDGNAKVMDFGIARANGSGMTQTGSVLGTAYYVSPEQAQGKELTAATDLYSLGVVLYEAVTGKLPFEGPDAVTVALKQVNQQPLPPSAVNPDIDPGLEQIILRAMAKDPAGRYATAEAMRTALNNFLVGRPIDEGIIDAQAATSVMAATPARRAVDRGSRPGSTETARPSRAALSPESQVARTQVMPAAVLGSQTTSNELLEESREKNRRPAIIAGIVAGLLVIGFVVFLVFNMMGETVPDMVSVPSVVGMSQSDAEQELRRRHLRLGDVKQEPSETVAKGRVISQDPNAGVPVDRESEVNLVISSGTEQPVQKQVPSIINMTIEEADQAIREAGFAPSYKGEQNHDTIEAGRVCDQSPAANSMELEGTTIGYYVSKGKESTSIPSVTGQHYLDGEQTLSDIGFKVSYDTNREYSDTVPKDCVIRQSPTAGTTAAKGSVVTLTLSDGPTPAVVPNILGMSPTEATTTLQAQGLSISFVYADTPDPSEVDKVISCDPGVDSKVPKGSTVQVMIGKAPPPPPPPPPPTPPGP